jgi:hypothetical protein
VGLANSQRRLRRDRTQAAQNTGQPETGHAHARAPQRLSATDQPLHTNQQNTNSLDCNITSASCSKGLLVTIACYRLLIGYYE